MKVFITRKIPNIGLQMIRDAGYEISQHTEKRELTTQELILACKGHDALLTAGRSKIDNQFLTSCSHLKVISLFSVGYDNVDIDTATKLGIPVGNTPGVLSEATADTAFLLMLAVSRKAFYLHKKIAKGEWNFFEPTANLGIELHGKTLGVLGLGKIGFQMAKLCVGAYRMKIIYHNRQYNNEAENELGAVKVSFEELLKKSDVLSVHTTLTPETNGLFDKNIFSKMKRTSIFINTARGAIHNEIDLADAIQQGVIWGAGLDVTNPEPMNATNKLLDMPTVAILPHIGSSTIETRNNMAKIAAQNIIAGLRNEKLPFIVNPEVYNSVGN